MTENSNTLVVDPKNQENYVKIAEAITAAKPGAKIIIRPGIYEENLVINKPLELVGDGGPGEIVIQAAGKDVILFEADKGRIANLTLRQMGKGDWYGIDIARGHLELEDCDISSKSLACIAIHDGADPIIRRNIIHGSKQGGVSIYDNGLGTLEENEIFGNKFFGVEIGDESNSTLQNNRIHDNKQSGVFIYNNSKGTLEENDVSSNAYSGIEVTSDSRPVLRKNKIHGNQQNGVLIQDGGKGIVEGNEIFGNQYAGVEARTGAVPTILGNRMSGNGYPAVWVHNNGGAVVEDNDLRDNPGGAWDIEPNCERNVKRMRNAE